MKSEEINVSGLNKLSENIFEDNKQKGFWDKHLNIGECLMLITGELAEALEAHRIGRNAKMKQFIMALKESKIPCEGNLDKVYYDVFAEIFRENVKDTVEDEIADALIRLLDLSAALEIDIEQQVWAKLMYNRGRPKRHGKLY